MKKTKTLTEYFEEYSAGSASILAIALTLINEQKTHAKEIKKLSKLIKKHQKKNPKNKK